MRQYAKRLGVFCAVLLAAIALIAGFAGAAHATEVASTLVKPYTYLPLVSFMGVTNTLGNYNETFFAQEALIQLEKVLGMAGRVHRGYDPEPKAKGDTIQIRRPATFTAQDAPAVSQDVATESVAVVVNKWKEVKFELTDKDLSLTNEKIISDHIRPAAVALADQIDQDLVTLYKQVPWNVTLSGTPVLGDIAKLRKIMFDLKVPLRDSANLNYMIDGNTELAFLTALAASGMMPNQQDTALREGSMGRLFGYDVWANQNSPTHTSGVAADSVGALTIATAKGNTTITFNGVTAAGTYKAGDIVQIAGDAQQYNVLADIAADGAGLVTGMQVSPAIKQINNIGAVVTVVLVGAAKSTTLAFHRNFACLATAPLTDIGNQLGAKIASISDPITGLSLRSRMFYDADNSKVKIALDVLYGFKLLDPNLAVRGTAA
jgi:hypothetical protein